MATDDERAVQFEEFIKQLISSERGAISVENKKMLARTYLRFSKL